MDIEVRRLQPGDEQLALRVVRELKPVEEREGREPGLAHLERLLGADTNYLLAALAGGAPVGFLTAYRMPALDGDVSMVYLFEIEVAPAFRRQGLGTRLIELLKRLCGATDVEDIWVGTENTNTAARRLYESTGGVYASHDNCEFIYELTGG
jgi:ribosomal protein S18 acetylase RimI-like enzyme